MGTSWRGGRVTSATRDWYQPQTIGPTQQNPSAPYQTTYSSQTEQLAQFSYYADSYKVFQRQTRQRGTDPWTVTRPYYAGDDVEADFTPTNPNDPTSTGILAQEYLTGGPVGIDMDLAQYTLADLNNNTPVHPLQDINHRVFATLQSDLTTVSGDTGTNTAPLASTTQLLERATYSAFGERTVLSQQPGNGPIPTLWLPSGFTNPGGSPIPAPNLKSRPLSAVGQTMGFQGRREEDLPGVLNFRHRMYDPHLGRFLEQDPANDPNSPNPYCFEANNPVNSLDPTGDVVTLGDSEDFVSGDELADMLGVNPTWDTIRRCSERRMTWTDPQWTILHKWASDRQNHHFQNIDILRYELNQAMYVEGQALNYQWENADQPVVLPFNINTIPGNTRWIFEGMDREVKVSTYAEYTGFRGKDPTTILSTIDEMIPVPEIRYTGFPKRFATNNFEFAAAYQYWLKNHTLPAWYQPSPGSAALNQEHEGQVYELSVGKYVNDRSGYFFLQLHAALSGYYNANPDDPRGMDAVGSVFLTGAGCMAANVGASQMRPAKVGFGPSASETSLGMAQRRSIKLPAIEGDTSSNTAEMPIIGNKKPSMLGGEPKLNHTEYKQLTANLRLQETLGSPRVIGSIGLGEKRVSVLDLDTGDIIIGTPNERLHTQVVTGAGRPLESGRYVGGFLDCDSDGALTFEQNSGSFPPSEAGKPNWADYARGAGVRIVK
ncbi:MAG: RHS repeat-associated core domain-containing protein [Rhodanobacteraceae bacterium]